MFPQNHFDGGKNITAENPKHLALILQKVMNDLLKLAGIKSLPEIVVADASPVAAANASDEATLVTLVNEEKSDYNGIVALLNDMKAKLAPLVYLEITAANGVASSVVDATNTATAITLVNDLKAKYNVAYLLGNQIKAELNESGEVEIAAADAVVEATANASDEATAIALANALKAKLNTLVTLSNEIKTDLNAIEKVELESLALFA